MKIFRRRHVAEFLITVCCYLAACHPMIAWGLDKSVKATPELEKAPAAGGDHFVFTKPTISVTEVVCCSGRSIAKNMSSFPCRAFGPLAPFLDAGVAVVFPLVELNAEQLAGGLEVPGAALVAVCVLLVLVIVTVVTSTTEIGSHGWDHTWEDITWKIKELYEEVKDLTTFKDDAIENGEWGQADDAVESIDGLWEQIDDLLGDLWQHLNS